MKRMVTLGLITCLAVLTLLSCAPMDVKIENSQKEEIKTARIGTWNLEWFGALGRSDDDIRRIATIIRELDLDVVALQEITCECILEKLAAELQYDYFISPQRVPQKLALIWDPRRVEKVEFDEKAYADLYKVAATGIGYESRQPLVFRMQIGNFDFTLMVVHLKAIPESDYSVRFRNIQYDAINEWLSKEMSQPGVDRDIIIAGDFNAFRSGISSDRLRSAGYVEFATLDLPKNEYSNIWYNREGNRILSLIDHIAVTPSLRQEEFAEVLPIYDWDEEVGRKNYEKHISDHLPLVAIFSTEKDLD